MRDDLADSWNWQLDRGSRYSVCGVYLFLTSLQSQQASAVSNLVWHKNVPLKVLVFAWRLHQNRLLTKDNLARRDVIAADASLCLAGCGDVESANHLLLTCNVFGNIWYLFSWPAFYFRSFWSFYMLIWQVARKQDALLWIWFGFLVFGSSGRKETTRSLILCKKYFSQLIDSVKHMSFWWLKTKIVNVSAGLYGWWQRLSTIWALVKCVLFVCIMYWTLKLLFNTLCWEDCLQRWLINSIL